MCHDDILSDVLFLMKVTFPLMFRSQLSVIFLMFSDILHETVGARPEAYQIVFHL